MNCLKSGLWCVGHDTAAGNTLGQQQLLLLMQSEIELGQYATVTSEANM